MKAFKYNLQGVLDIRRLQQDQQVGRFVVAARELHEQLSVLDGLREAVAQLLESEVPE